MFAAQTKLSVMKKSVKLIAGVVLLGLFPVFQSCEAEAIQDAIGPNEANLSIERNSLIGKWNLSVLKADKAVDLNEDGTASFDLLQETSCFDSMSISFNEDGTLETVNSRLDFNGAEPVECSSERKDIGSWEVEGDILVFTIAINGTEYTHRKQIEQTSNSFAFEVEKWESEQYVDDPGDTAVSGLSIISVTYSRVE